MPDHEHNRPDPYGPDGFVQHARYRAGLNPSGIGAAVVRSGYEQGAHRWQCIVSDGRDHHYLNVIAPTLGPRPNIATPDLEQAIEAFAQSLPEDGRLRALRNANPLHLDAAGVIGD